MSRGWLTDASFRGNKGSKCFTGGYFCAKLVTQPTVYLSHCELDAMLCQGLSKCLHLLMLVNQHRRIVGVWILNPWGEEVRVLAQVLVQAAVFCLWGEGTPSEPWQPGTLMVSGVERQSSSSTPGIWPSGKSYRRSQRVLFIVTAYLAHLMLFSPALQCKSFLACFKMKRDIKSHRNFLLHSCHIPVMKSTILSQYTACIKVNIPLKQQLLYTHWRNR